jgi:hypothetical protein
MMMAGMPIAQGYTNGVGEKHCETKIRWATLLALCTEKASAGFSNLGQRS